MPIPSRVLPLGARLPWFRATDLDGQVRQASDDCRGDLDATFERALVQAEAEFVAEHHASLEAHRSELVADHRRFDLPVAPLQ